MQVKTIAFIAVAAILGLQGSVHGQSAPFPPEAAEQDRAEPGPGSEASPESPEDLEPALRDVERSERQSGRIEVPRAREWQRYRNPRWGYALDVPTDLFATDVILPDGRGETMLSADGRSRLAVFALPNPAGKSLARVAADYLREAGDPVVTYRRRTRNGHLVVSGNRGADVFYLRVAEGRGGVHGLDLAYPTAVERAFDPIVTRISRSFRPGR